MTQERRHGLRPVDRRCRQVQCRYAAVGGHGIGMATRLEQHHYYNGVSSPAAQVERSVAADARLRLYVGGRCDQQLGDLGMAALGGPVQRGHAVAPRFVHIHALIEERPDGFGVSPARGLDDFDAIGNRGSGRGVGACQDESDAEKDG